MATPRPLPDLDSEVLLERLYREHGRQLYRFALRMLGNREDAEDAIQIALLDAHRALARRTQPERPREWLFAIVQNACYRIARARARREVPADLEDGLQPPEHQPEAPEDTDVAGAVASLPPAQREILFLRAMHDLSYAELSQTLGISLAAAESLLARARRSVREQLGERPSRRRGILAAPGAYLPKLGWLSASRLPRAALALKAAGVLGAAAVVPALTLGVASRTHSAPAAADAPTRVVAPATSVTTPSARAATRSTAAHRPSTNAAARGAVGAAARAVVVAATSARRAGTEASRARLSRGSAPAAQQRTETLPVSVAAAATPTPAPTGPRAQAAGRLIAWPNVDSAGGAAVQARELPQAPLQKAPAPVPLPPALPPAPALVGGLPAPDVAGTAQDVATTAATTADAAGSVVDDATDAAAEVVTTVEEVTSEPPPVDPPSVEPPPVEPPPLDPPHVDPPNVPGAPDLPPPPPGVDLPPILP